MCDYVRECIFIHSTAAVAIILYEILLLHTTFNTIGGIVLLLLLLLRRRDCYFLVNEVIAHATTISKQSLTAQSLFFSLSPPRLVNFITYNRNSGSGEGDGEE